MNDQETIIALRAELKQTKLNLEEIQRRYRNLPETEKDKRWAADLVVEATRAQGHIRTHDTLVKQLCAAREQIAESDKALLRILVIVADVHGIKMVDIMKLVKKK